MSSDGPRLAVLISFSGEGGVERMVLNLVEGLAAQGHPVDLLAIRADSAHLGQLPDGVRLVDLGVRHSLPAVPAIARYLRQSRPAALLAAKDRAIRAAVLARALSGVRVRLVGRLGTNLSAALEGRARTVRWLRTAPMRAIYARVDAVVCVSEGVLADTRVLTGLDSPVLRVVRNPVVTPALFARAAEAIDHPWLADRAVPVVIAAGRLTAQKDFATLLRAFARARRDRPMRLIILGDGGHRARLTALAATLEIDHVLDMPGFRSNPHAWMTRAGLFVLSSAWEGSPNVLTEALALGVPSVATDCPSGPREVLADGRYGPLVPVGDDAALAEAMLQTLANPLPPETLREAVRDYQLEASLAGYRAALLPESTTGDAG